jgi:hypothetical protein
MKSENLLVKFFVSHLSLLGGETSQIYENAEWTRSVHSGLFENIGNEGKASGF